MNVSNKLPTFFISHGGSPAFWINWNPSDVFDRLKNSLQKVPQLVGVKPKSILIISAHWEEDDFTVQSTQSPGMIYDYSGFPSHTYKLQYPASGNPELAKRVQELLEKKNIVVKENKERGYDHGVFVPLLVMYPDHDVPVVQLSIKKGYSPEDHFKVGEALSPLREEGVLILGSGFSFHNLEHFSDSQGLSKEFDDWLKTTIVKSNPEERFKGLLDWENAPNARFSHPEADHLIPLMVIAGAAQKDSAKRFYNEQMKKFNFWTSSFQFGQTVRNG